jgi:LEA14-like dessication related protein
MRSAAFYAFWLAVAASSLFALVHISDDYIATVTSLRDFEWRVTKFETPKVGAEHVTLEIEIRNRSNVDLPVKDLEVYLWLNDVTVGKTYGQFRAQNVQAHQAVVLPLTIEMDVASLRDALDNDGGVLLWHISGSYKVAAPFTDSNFVYHLMLDVDS